MPVAIQQVTPLQVGKLQVPQSLKTPVKVGISGDRIVKGVFNVLDDSTNRSSADIKAINMAGPNNYGTPNIHFLAQHVNNDIKTRGDSGRAIVVSQNEISLRGKSIRVSVENDPRQIPWDSACAEHVVEASQILFMPSGHHPLSGKPMSSTLDLHLTHHYNVETAITSEPPDEVYEVDTFYIPRVMNKSVLNGVSKVSTGSFTIASLAPVLQVAQSMFGLVEFKVDIINTIRTNHQLRWETNALSAVLPKIIPQPVPFQIAYSSKRNTGYRTFLSFKTVSNFDRYAFLDELKAKSQGGQIFEDLYSVDAKPPAVYVHFPYTYSAYVSSVASLMNDLKKGYVILVNNEKGYGFIVAQAMLDLIDVYEQNATSSRNVSRRKRGRVP